jgi:hypothetical protein
MFEDSPNSKAIWDYFNGKYGQMIAPIGLAKACAVMSPKLNERYTCSVFAVAPTRQFKSMTSADASRIFPKGYYIQLGSDFTLHDIMEHYGSDLKKVCLMINDATLLFQSKGKRTRDRLINGFAELLSERYYRYGDRLSQLELKGKVSIIMNMTMEMYQYHKDKLLGSTFLERFITLFYAMPVREQLNFVEEKHKRVGFSWRDFRPEEMRFKRKIVFGDFLPKMTEITQRISVLGGKSFFGTDDQIKSLCSAHAGLNGREKIGVDELFFINTLIPYFDNPFAPNEHKIIEFARQGRSQKDICLLLDKSPEKYQPYVSKVVKKAKMRGLITI